MFDRGYTLRPELCETNILRETETTTVRGEEGNIKIKMFSIYSGDLP